MDSKITDSNQRIQPMWQGDVVSCVLEVFANLLEHPSS